MRMTSLYISQEDGVYLYVDNKFQIGHDLSDHRSSVLMLLPPERSIFLRTEEMQSIFSLNRSFVLSGHVKTHIKNALRSSFSGFSVVGSLRLESNNFYLSF